MHGSHDRRTLDWTSAGGMGPGLRREDGCGEERMNRTRARAP
ncbi:MAG: hypothetical protein O2985_14525 [Proteobacteria bacterium]|nr:hypothetical protein [Pseudomonadota bacterium]